jgi:L-ectoine synthase
MIVRDLSTVKTVEWGNGLSRRFLLAEDGLGYTVTDTLVQPGTSTRIEYKNHLEACYCIDGHGEVIDTDGRSHPIVPGTMYALDQHDPHHLVATSTTPLRLVCVFSPALSGDEAHRLDADGFSHY